MIACDPFSNALLTHCAVPPVIGTAPHPAITFPPSRNTTVPVGVAPVPVTVAVNVTACPTVDGLLEEVSAVVEAGSCVKLAVTVQLPVMALVVKTLPTRLPVQVPVTITVKPALGMSVNIRLAP